MLLFQRQAVTATATLCEAPLFPGTILLSPVRRLVLLQLTDEETEAQTSDTIYVTGMSEHQGYESRRPDS